jgi:hypothetical protein
MNPYTLPERALSIRQPLGLFRWRKNLERGAV